MTRMTYSKGPKELEESGLSNEFIALQNIYSRGTQEWFADGTLHVGQRCFRFRRLLCNTFRFPNSRGIHNHSNGDKVWIRTIVSSRYNVWYRLRNPAPEYVDYYRPFLWMLDLAKHLIDFLTLQRTGRWRIQDFFYQRKFCRWLEQNHNGSPEFRKWYSEIEGLGFGSVIAANISFLSTQISDAGLETSWYFVRTEVDPSMLKAVPAQDVITDLTTVTLYVYQCFRHMPWAHLLQVQQPTESTGIGSKPKDNHGLTSGPEVVISDRSVKVGDIVALASDSMTWQGTEAVWYAYVQALQETNAGMKMDLLWLYRPTDTSCQAMKYPHAKELFLGTHCNCGDEPVYTHEVLSKPKVRFFYQDDQCDFFVRQKYDDNESAWLTLQDSDFRCLCKCKKSEVQYQIGDTVLVEMEEDKLEPFELVEIPEAPYQILGRKLLRKTEFNLDARPNELLFSNIFVKFPHSRIIRTCQVRFFMTDAHIPAPYCRNGTAAFFFITHEITSEAVIQPLRIPMPSALRQAPEIMSTKPLQGLDIFCGGGNLGRGLEEGGAVRFRWAVDYYKEAIHTYKANSENDVSFYYGSVNDYLRQAIRGKRLGSVAQKGEVQFISAGSPCQGFSTANQNKGSAESQRNVSMVASVVSFIDFYRPKYAVLENVTTMAMCGQGRDHSQNVFAQVLCALVGMGYQVRPFRLDAWSFGSPQSRTRLFISVSAQGLPPMEEPFPSHSHPDHVSAACLGRTANGLPLGGRYWEPSPFEYVTIKDATKDLPLNDHGKLPSIRFPDHRMSRNLTSNNRIRLASVPKKPPSMTFIKAVKKGWMPQRQVDTYTWLSKCRTHDLSRAWQRVNPIGLLPTVTTNCSPEDGISGTWVHWEADRLITIMEARRAQGFPDHEVIVGIPAAQWKIIGNSVARPVALALGFALRKAWEKAQEDAPSTTLVTCPTPAPMPTPKDVELPDRRVCEDSEAETTARLMPERPLNELLDYLHRRAQPPYLQQLAK